MMATLALTVELLQFGAPPRAMVPALRAAAEQHGATVICTDTYRGDSDLLVVWGPGHPARFEPMRRQVERGGHVLALDLAYWDRQRKVRFSIDAAHPQAWVMKRDWPSDRLRADGVRVTDAWHRSGPVVVAGIGAKALVQYGSVVPEWEQSLIAACQRRGRRVIYRPKRPEYPSPTGVEREDRGTIEDVLTGASLLVTWHSNTAVDALRMGIPAICRDGAAAAVCASALPPSEDPLPLDPVVRDRFLANLSYFQWAPHEASAAWLWLMETLS